MRLSSRLQDLVYRENEVTCTTGWQEIVDKLNFFTTEAHKNVAAVARHEQNIAGLLEELNVASWVCAIYVLVLHLNNHMPTRRIAEDWINPRTGKPYSHMHVKRVLQAVTQALRESSAAPADCKLIDRLKGFNFKQTLNRVSHPKK